MAKITIQNTISFAHSEFEKYRIMQDKQFESDFDRFAKLLMSEKIKDE